jgi:hypothetical protein
MDIYQKLIAIQTELKAPKSQFNSFGKYNYRNQEDILEAVKPLLKKHGLTLVIDDEIVLIGNRYYVKAEATLMSKDESTGTCAYAREEEEKRGMDASQITGSASSYARKYALNGLFLIDDTRDADSHDNSSKPNVAPKVAPKETSSVNATDPSVMVAKCSKCATPINTAVAVFSKNKFGKILCRKCQESEK